MCTPPGPQRPRTASCLIAVYRSRLDPRVQRGPVFQFRRCAKRCAFANCRCEIRGASGEQEFTQFSKDIRATGREATERSRFNRVSQRNCAYTDLVRQGRIY
eukprot:5826960-Pyramimonas_sp.AAC.1